MLDFTISTARSAGALLQDYFERGISLERKTSEIDLVTDADRAAEELIVSAIRVRFPDHSIVSEESHWHRSAADNLAGGAEYTWIVDPLDGTVNFAHGFPVFCVSIALRRHAKMVLGVIYDPVRDELFAAERGRGVFLNGKRRQVSTSGRLLDSLLATGFAYTRASIPDNNVAEFSRVVLKCQGVRRAGAAALDMAYVATGRLDGYWEMHLAPWDWAAGAVMVIEGGGTLTTVDGSLWDLADHRVLATNGIIHAELLKALRGDES